MSGITIPQKNSRVSTLLIEGGYKLSGRVAVEGNKNAALPLLAACMLTEHPCVLTNVPRISDVGVMVQLLVSLGADIEGLGTTTLRVCCKNVLSNRPNPTLVGQLRGSVLLLGPLLARIGSARLEPPGGDFPGRRTLTAHLRALEAMGAQEVDGAAHALDAPDGLTGASIYFEEASVTGTETAILAAASAKGATELRHAACEPHVIDLCHFLREMGVGISGDGTPTIRINPQQSLIGASYRLSGDYVEAGSWMVVSAVTGGGIEVTGARSRDMEPITAILRRMNVSCLVEDENILVKQSTLVGGRQITTGPWPGFPSDMVSLTTVLATQAEGRTLIHDWMYELRLFALEQLSGMGANLFLCDPHRIIVDGPRQLTGRGLDSRDLRSGMALIAAALAGTGVSRIRPLETVERGYGQLVDRLRSLGAHVAVEVD